MVCDGSNQPNSVDNIGVASWVLYFTDIDIYAWVSLHINFIRVICINV